MAANSKMDMDDYALVTAGLSDGLELSELLAHIGQGAEAWATASAYWDNLLLDSLDDGPEMALQLDALQRKARQKWQRRLEPIESDQEAWLTFLHYYTRHADPAAYLSQHDVTIAELAHLSGVWAERFSADENLRAEAAVWRQRAVEHPLTDEVVLHPSPRPVLPPKSVPALDGGAAAEPKADTEIETTKDEADETSSMPPAPPLLMALPEPIAHSPTPNVIPMHQGRFGLGGGIDATGAMPSFDDVVEVGEGLPFEPLASSLQSSQPPLPTPSPSSERIQQKLNPIALTRNVALPSSPVAMPLRTPSSAATTTAPSHTPTPAPSDIHETSVLNLADLNFEATPFAKSSVSVQADGEIAAGPQDPTFSESTSGNLDATGALSLAHLDLEAMPFVGRLTDAPEPVADEVLASAPTGSLDATGMLDAALLNVPVSPYEKTAPLDELARDAVEKAAADRLKRSKTGTVGMAPASQHSAKVAHSESADSALATLYVGPAGETSRRYALPVFAAMVTSIERARAEGQHEATLAQLGLNEADYRALYAQSQQLLTTEALRLAWAALGHRLAGTATRPRANTPSPKSSSSPKGDKR